MKKLITLSAMTMAALSLQAQTTINLQSFASWTPGTDTFYEVTQANPTPSANATWDLSAALYGNKFTRTKTAVSNPSIPGGTFVVPSTYSFSVLSYQSDVVYGINAQGVQRMGEIIPRQAYSIATTTMNPADSVVFLNQAVAYSAPRTVLAFPVTSTSNWTSSYVWNTNFQITLTAAGLNQTPGFRRSRISTVDTVKGWGKMRVQNRVGVTTGYMDVLAVKTIITITDSFFLGGQPAPPAILNGFGLTQGLVNKNFSIGYYRAGEMEPLLMVNYTDATFSTPSSAVSHASRVAPAATSVSEVAAAKVQVYPNPVTDGQLYISIADGFRALSYELTNAVGQQVAADQLTPVSGNAAIKISQPLTGMHYLRILSEGRTIATRPVLMQP